MTGDPPAEPDVVAVALASFDPHRPVVSPSAVFAAAMLAAGRSAEVADLDDLAVASIDQLATTS
jgi:hypothetical protein